MPTNKKKLRIISGSQEYSPMPHGKMAGKPTVRLKLSSSDTNATEVGSLEKKMEGWGWKRKIQSGFARMRFHGSEPLGEIHREGLEAFNSIVSPTFVDIEVDKQSINRVPPRYIQNLADSFTVFVPLDRSYDEEAFEFFAEQSRSFGNVEFIFKVGEWNDDEKVRDITSDYKIYDSDVWLYPKGRKIETVAENMERCEKWGKRYTWNVSPRFDVREIEDE